LEKIDNLGLSNKIIVVDDGSFDNTYQHVINYSNGRVLAIRHKINLGKGAALKTGCQAALILGAEVIVLIDGDGQHPPEIIPLMVEKIKEENLDLVFGSRKIRFEKMPFVFYAGNKLLTKVINFFSKISISDSQSGLKAFKSSAYHKLEWKACDYYVETEMIFNAGKNKLKYGEVFIDTVYKDNYKGTTPFDGIKILFRIIKSKLS
jgi:glycosyltransferase involved in cell wall biosynthesis